MSYREKSKENSNNSGPIELNPWIVRGGKIHDLVDNYVKQLRRISTIYSESIQSGWDVDLIQYVQAVAHVQAQYIIPSAGGIGYDGFHIFGSRSTEAERRIFLNNQKTQADMGFIDVSIPTGLIDEWKSMARWRIEREKPKQTHTVAPEIKTPIDIEIARQILEKVA